VRSPGFEPGSSTWQADVLNQTRLRPPETSTNDREIMEEVLKGNPNSRQRIHDLTIKLKNNGLDLDTVKCYGYKLSQLDRETDLNDPQKVKEKISELKNKKTGKPLSNASKSKFVHAYQHYIDKYGLEWERPKYKVPENTPLIPKKDEVQAIIDNSSENYVCIFTIESEIGCCPEELHLVTRDKINEENGEISITGVKGHGSKNYRLKKRTAELLRLYLARNPKEQPFPKAHTQSQMFLKYKKKAAKKLNRPELMKIELRNLRNYSGERFYKSLPVRDPIAVMQHFRHKKLETTMHYLRAMLIEYEEDDNWISLITKSTEEECKAIEKGYQLVRAINETTAIYRKRK
jgi:hypothetical protein